MGKEEDLAHVATSVKKAEENMRYAYSIKRIAEKLNNRLEKENECNATLQTVGKEIEKEKERRLKIALEKNEYLGQTKSLVELAYKVLGKRFKAKWDETDKEIAGRLILVAYDNNNEKLFSINNPGDYAPVEEAVDILIDQLVEEE